MSVIDRFVIEAWFMNGWEGSHGATKEFVHCVDSGISCHAADGRVLNGEDAIILMVNAAEDLRRMNMDIRFLEKRMVWLRQRLED